MSRRDHAAGAKSDRVMSSAQSTTSSQHTATQGAPRALRLRLHSDTAQIAPTRRAIEQLAASWGFDAAAQADIGLCVNEALANVIRHAYANSKAKPIEVSGEYLTPTPQQPSASFRVTIRDWGSGRNPSQLAPKPRDPLVPGGLGLICLKELMDEVNYLPQPDGMLLTMVKLKR
jgi:serine/threonine-protein kinase RsbW